MIRRFYILFIVLLVCSSFYRPDKEYAVFQFPQNMIPRIDGDFHDWEIVPDAYSVGLAELRNTVFGEGEELDPEDFDLKVKVGWVKGLNRLYFYIDAFDDYWDFKDRGLRQDIFELVVDGDASGGEFINQDNWNLGRRNKDQAFYEGKGTAAQNYHVFLPAYEKDWAMPWGNKPWIKEFPFANSAYDYQFKQGERGRLQMEFYVSLYDFAAFSGPQESEESSLIENDLIGMSWAMLDFDGKKCESFMNLSHDFNMINNASYLCPFRLMPVEKLLLKSVKADWKCEVDKNDPYLVRFMDASHGELSTWHWDFGDGNTSNEKNPVHMYNETGAWTVVLTVEGPLGKSSRSKVWEVVVY